MVTVVFFFASSVLFFCLPPNSLFASAEDNMPICPHTFSCPNFLPFKYPFYNATQNQCGLIKVSCNSAGGNITLGEHSYRIVGKYDYDSSVVIYNNTFEKLVNTTKCKALMNNFTSPSPLLFSVSIAPFITLFKCKKINQTNIVQQMDAYFKQSNYNIYNGCQDHRFYYKYLINNATVPSDLPDRCEVIQLPVKEASQFRGNQTLNETDIFSLLSSHVSISFKLTPSCEECYKKGGHCDHTNNGQFKCLHARTGIYKLTPSCEECSKKGGHCDANNGHFKCLNARTVAADNHRSTKLILAISGSVFIIMLCFCIFIIWRCRKRNPFSYVSSKNKSPDLEDRSLFCGLYVFSYTELIDATENFNPSHELGDGGFGTVYYGKLKDGREVAVKRLYEHNYKRFKHFMNEVEILTKLCHPNLVVLYGCTSQESRELLLVYEYIPNGTVADHLHGEGANPSLLTWPIRLNIAIETASALVYLHASEIIHRDVKTNNILLDHNFCVKVADFGLSRLLPNNVSHVSTAPQGTPGYVDPQYHQRYQLTDKSDVYSFGVVLIELISSMVAVDLNRSKDEIGLANLALRRIHKCELDELIDPVLGSDSNIVIRNMITSVAELAFRCLQYDSEMRPTMNEVLDVLMDIQAEGRTDVHDSITNFGTVNPPPPSETSDAMVLLKDFQRPSPVSVTSEWQSDNSASTTISSNGDRLQMKNCISNTV